MDQTEPRAAKAFVGALAGAVTTLLGCMILDRREPPIPIISIVLPLAIGAVGGSALALFAGSRRVSVFWPYLVVVFGLITVMPWWYNPMTHSYLPVGTVYVNPASTALIAVVVSLHSIVSVLFAAGLAALSGAPRIQFSLKSAFVVTTLVSLLLAISRWIVH